jgi:hypothetical protein
LVLYIVDMDNSVCTRSWYSDRRLTRIQARGTSHTGRTGKACARQLVVGDVRGRDVKVGSIYLTREIRVEGRRPTHGRVKVMKKDHNKLVVMWLMANGKERRESWLPTNLTARDLLIPIILNNDG